MDLLTFLVVLALLLFACGVGLILWGRRRPSPFGGGARRRGGLGGGFLVVVLVLAVAAGVTVSTTPVAGALAGW